MESETRNRKKRILSWVLVGVIAFVVAGMIFPMFSRSRKSANGDHDACRHNMKQLIFAELMYADDHGGKFSERLSDLYPEYINHPDVFRCPSAGGPKIERKEDIDSLTNYVLREGLTTASPPDEVLIYEPPSNHGKDDEFAAFVNGDVRWLSEAEIRRIVEKDSTQTK